MRNFLLIASSFLLAGCGGSFSVDYNANSNTDSSTGETKIVNSKVFTGSNTSRSSLRDQNGWVRRFDSTGNLTFTEGKLVKWDPNVVIKLVEKKNGVTKEGEYRADGAKLALFMKHDGKFVAGDAAEKTWADGLLSSFHLDDTPEPAKEKVLTDKLASKSLSSAEQKDVVDKTFSKLNDREGQVRVLQQLIARADFTRDTGHYLMDHIDKIHYEKDRKVIERALIDKEYK